MDCTIRIAKTKALISCAVTAQLICLFVFAYAKSRFSHNEAQILLNQLHKNDEFPVISCLSDFLPFWSFRTRFYFNLTILYPARSFVPTFIFSYLILCFRTDCLTSVMPKSFLT